MKKLSYIALMLFIVPLMAREIIDPDGDKYIVDDDANTFICQ